MSNGRSQQIWPSPCPRGRLSTGGSINSGGGHFKPKYIKNKSNLIKLVSKPEFQWQRLQMAICLIKVIIQLQKKDPMAELYMVRHYKVEETLHGAEIYLEKGLCNLDDFLNCHCFDLTLQEKQDLRVSLCLQLISSVHWLHSKGFVHRDIKPTNIIIFRVNGRIVAKLGDLEMAEKPANKLIGSIGTLQYANYKMGRSKCEVAELSFRSDIFALGVTCYQILYDCRPLQQQIEELVERTSSAIGQIKGRVSSEETHNQEQAKAFKQHYDELEGLYSKGIDYGQLREEYSGMIRLIRSMLDMNVPLKMEDIVGSDDFVQIKQSLEGTNYKVHSFEQYNALKRAEDQANKGQFHPTDPSAKKNMDKIVSYLRLYAGTSPSFMVRKIALEDKNNDRQFQLEQFQECISKAVHTVSRGQKSISKEEIASVFRALDRDGNRWIDRDELVELFRTIYKGKDMKVFKTQIKQVLKEGNEENSPYTAN